jgi:hypothetical protein
MLNWAYLHKCNNYCLYLNLKVKDAKYSNYENYTEAVLYIEFVDNWP